MPAIIDDGHQRIILDDGFGNILGGSANPINANLALGGLAVGSGNAVPIYDAYSSPTTVSWTSATPVNTALTLNTAGMDTVVFTIVPTGTITSGAIAFEAFDGVNWISVKSPRTDSYSTDSLFTLSGSPGTHSWEMPVAGYPQARARLSTAIAGSGSVGVTGLASSAPDCSIVTVGMDPLQPLPAGANTIGNVTSVGAASIAFNQVTVGTSATLIAAARTGAPGTGRVAITIYNNGAAAIVVGGATVTTATGLIVIPGGSLTLNTTAAIYAISATAGQNVGYLETY